jgi:hypothetical protein
MRTTCSILAVALLLELGWAPGLFAAPTEKTAATPAAELVTKLGSNKYLEREAATRSLAELGPLALDALHKASQSPDCEVRRRAASLIQTIERQIETAKFTAPKRVRLVFKEVPVAEAVAEFAKQTRFPIVLNEADSAKLAKRKITLDTGETTFWQAFDQFCQKAGLAEHDPVGNMQRDGYVTMDARGNQVAIMYSGAIGTDVSHDPRLVLADAKSQARPTCYAGAVRVRTAAPGGPPVPAKSERDTPLMLEVMPEPGMTWRGVLDVQISKAVDEHGQVLVPSSGPAGLPGPAVWNLQGRNIIMRGGGAIFLDPSGQAAVGEYRHVPIWLQQAEKPAKTVKELHGIIACQVQAIETLATVDNILKAGGRTVKTTAGSNLKVVDCTHEESGLIRVRVQLDLPGQGMFFAGGRVRFNRRVMAFNGNGGLAEGGVPNLALVDAKGGKLQQVRTEQRIVATGNGWSQEYHLTYSPQQGQGDPVKLVYTGPRTVTLEVPFTLKDVPLP